MADKQSNAPADTAQGKAVSSDSIWTGEPDGWHPIRPLSEQDWAAENLKYRAMPDSEKPDPSTVAEIQVLPEDK
jgi:hypothetical protein